MRDAIARAIPLTWPAKHWLRVTALSALLFAGAAAALLAQAQTPHGAGSSGPGMMMFGGSPEHMAHVIGRMLDGIDATDTQRSQIKQIAMSAAADVEGQRGAGRGLRDQAMQIFTASSVDPVAAESVRQQMLVQHDQASKRMLQAMLEAAKVLTPDQRAKMGSRFKERHMQMRDRMQPMHQGRPSQPGASVPLK